jgi:hypothetical protein
MIYQTVLAILFSLSPPAPAETCNSRYWVIKGNLSPEVDAYDQFLASLPADATDKINDYIHRHGLLLQLNSASGTEQGYENYLSGESSSGLNVGLFLRYMRVMKQSNASFDTVYEVENANAKHALRKWSVPFAAPPPQAIDAFGIIYPETMVGVCTELKRKVFLEVSTEGNYRAIARDAFPPANLIPEGKCNAQRTFFAKSRTAACGKFKDLNSGETRILVWDERIK